MMRLRRPVCIADLLKDPGSNEFDDVDTMAGQAMLAVTLILPNFRRQ